MVKAVSRTFPLDLMMKSVHFQVKKRLSFEVQKVAVGAKLNSWAKRASTAKRRFSTLSMKENLAEHKHQGHALSARSVR